MSVSRADRVLAALGCQIIFGVFAGTSWIEGYTSVSWFFILLGISFMLVFFLASESVLKILGSLW